jgi:septum formation protein
MSAGPGTGRTVVLASASPRRAELLGRIGVPHEVVPADVDESVHEDEDAFDYVRRVAHDKARAVSGVRPGRVVLGADTAVVLDGRPLGKPADADDAARMLRSLSGRVHTVVTAVTVVDPRGAATSVTSSAEVTVAELSEAEISAYVATGEPLDKAGAYAIQGVGAVLVERLDGDPTTVIGLPLRPTRDLLRAAGAQ